MSKWPYPKTHPIRLWLEGSPTETPFSFPGHEPVAIQTWVKWRTFARRLGFDIAYRPSAARGRWELVAATRQEDPQ